MKIALSLVGFGNVARRFVSLLDESRHALTELDVEPVIVGIATRRLGCDYKSGGLDAAEAVRRAVAGLAIGPAAGISTAEWIARHPAAHSMPHVVVETTTLDVRSGEPALSHVRAGFSIGAHVITANKGPVAFAYRNLAREAASANVSFFFEGAVMDGIPIFNLVRETLPAVTINGFRGVVNSTTNHIITALERGESFEGALRRMQDAGIAEADPSLDVDGWDAAAKTAALANVLLDAGTTPHLIPREGIGPATGARARAALASGRRLKLIARAGRRGARVESAVELQELDAGDPLATLDGQGNALELDTTPLGRIVIMQRDGGLEMTAYALLTDLVAVAKRIQGRS